MGLFVSEDAYRPAALRYTETPPTRADELIAAARGEIGRLQGFVRALCDDLAQYSAGQPEPGQEHWELCVNGVDVVAVTEPFDSDDGAPGDWSIVGVLVNGADVLPIMDGLHTDAICVRIQELIDDRNARDRADMEL